MSSGVRREINLPNRHLIKAVAVEPDRTLRENIRVNGLAARKETREGRGTGERAEPRSGTGGEGGMGGRLVGFPDNRLRSLERNYMLCRPSFRKGELRPSHTQISQSRTGVKIVNVSVHTNEILQLLFSSLLDTYRQTHAHTNAHKWHIRDTHHHHHHRPHHLYEHKTELQGHERIEL
jgi:hypothetical protein